MGHGGRLSGCTNATPRLAAGFVVALAAGGCAGQLSALDPAGPSSEAIHTLWKVMLAGSAVLFGLTMILLGLSWMGFRPLARIREMAWLVAGGLVLPGLVLTPLAIYGFAVGEKVFARPGAPDLRVEAIGRRWAWEFAYPEAGGLRTQGVLHIPAGARVDVRVTSADVIHSFWVPRLGGKMDAIPGHANHIRIAADRPGVFRGVCSEYCGPGHAGMEFAVQAHEPAAYPEALRRAAGAAP